MRFLRKKQIITVLLVAVMAVAAVLPVSAYNNAPGAGFSFVLKCTEPYDGAIVGPGPMVIATSGQWISGAGIKYLNYLSGKNVVGRAYYVAGRIDNDYHNTYSCNGYFNSDRVS